VAPRLDPDTIELLDQVVAAVNEVGKPIENRRPH